MNQDLIESPALFVLIFPLFWLAISCSLSLLSGWSRIASVYRAEESPKGRRYRMQSAKIGLVNYGSCLTIHASDECLYIKIWTIFRLGNASLFLRWSAINDRKKGGQLFKVIDCEIGSPVIGKMTLPAKVFEMEPRG